MLRQSVDKVKGVKRLVATQSEHVQETAHSMMAKKLGEEYLPYLKEANKNSLDHLITFLGKLVSTNEALEQHNAVNELHHKNNNKSTESKPNWKQY